MTLGVEAALVDGELVPGDVRVDENGTIAAVGLASRGSGIAAPGFVDLQVNGFAGIDFLDADADGYRRAGAALLQTGVTAYLPTLVTASEAALLDALGQLPGRSDNPRVLGAHLEGPFLSPERLGAHLAAHRRDPDAALLDRLLAAGPVALVTLAPELPGALELVSRLRERGIVVSLGHTDATAAVAHAAFDRGARTVTHVFNAMRPLTSREAGVAGAALARDDVVVQAIFDGVHLAPETEQLVVSAAPGRLALVTDTISAATLGDGAFTLGGAPVTVERGVARRAGGVLAGSTLTMPQAVRNLVDRGVALERVLEAASTTPARLLGLPETSGLTVGSRADLVVLDDRLEVRRTLLDGRDCL